MPPDDVRQAPTAGDGDVRQAPNARQGRKPQDEPVSAGRDCWRTRFHAACTRDANFTTISGVEAEPVDGPDDGAVVPGFERIGWPGQYTFTRGLIWGPFPAVMRHDGEVVEIVELAVHPTRARTDG